jgi:purine-cytosine permease-like protein
MRDYLSKTQPVSPTARTSWLHNLLPCYLGMFVWLGYYQGLSGGTIDRAPFGLLFFAILVGGLLSHVLFFRIPATMGMQTGYPTGVIGSSTFGSQGAQFAPGLLVGLVQAALLGVSGYYAARAIVVGLGLEGGGGQAVQIGFGASWCLLFAFLGRFGLKLVVRIAFGLSVLPVLVMVAGVFSAKEGIAQHGLDLPEPVAAFNLTVHMVTAFFATIAAASPGLARYAESKNDIQVGGFFGIVIPACLMGGVGILTVAGARYLIPGLEGFGYLEAVTAVMGRLGPAMAGLLLVGGIPAALFIAWMANDSFAVMLPETSRTVNAIIVGVLAAVVCATGLPGNLQVFFTVTAALTAPLCGIMAADFWQHDKRWPHTRPGINYAGYGALALGIIVGTVPLLPIPEHLLMIAHPAAVYSCLAGFIGYIVLGNMGLKPYRKHRRKRIRKARFDEEQKQPRTSRAEWER